MFVQLDGSVSEQNCGEHKMPVGGGHGGATNSVNARQSEAVSLPIFLPTTPTKGHFVLSPVKLASRDQDGRLVELNDRRQRSHGKLGTVDSLPKYRKLGYNKNKKAQKITHTLVNFVDHGIMAHNIP